MQKKSAFTIIEILLVVIAVGLLATIGARFFNSTRQEKVIFWENCSTYIYNSLYNFTLDITYWKASLQDTLSWATWYMIKYDPLKIQLWGMITGNFVPSQIIHLWKNVSNIQPSQWCRSEAFSLITSAPVNSFTVSIPKRGESLRYNIAPDVRDITWNLPNATLDLYVCNKEAVNKDDESCVDVARIVIDKRSRQLLLHKCVQRKGSWWTCSTRPTSF